MSSAAQQLTLFLWVDGLFPRRVTWYLLQKGLVSSPEALLRGETADPNLSIVRLSPGPEFLQKGWDFNPADDPLPREISTSSPCLRVTKSDNTIVWVRESLSILYYLETLYGNQGSPIVPPVANTLEVAFATDALGALENFNQGLALYMAHASPTFASMRGIKDEERSRSLAENGHAYMVGWLVKLQERCAPSLETSGWLTLGTSGPGIVDLCLAPHRQYLELVYGVDFFSDEKLGPLQEWWVRFRAAYPWWKALEEREGVHPEHMKFKLEFVF
ncbi:hypothetical protein F5Y16DRAFT_348391 [Xylariaceae sp. FL0255]|nr:hypothetical protein F5Y16DRAFT_348391 [Xylariaceae sp. FL0255]